MKICPRPFNLCSCIHVNAFHVSVIACACTVTSLLCIYASMHAYMLLLMVVCNVCVCIVTMTAKPKL